MDTRLASRVASLVFASAMTLAMLLFVDTLAQRDAPPQEIAKVAAPSARA